MSAPGIIGTLKLSQGNGEIILFELNRLDYERARPIFRKMENHLPLQAILAGNVFAPIYVDNTLHPQTAITWVGHQFFLAGSPGNTDLIAAARKIFLEKFSMSAWRKGYDSYLLHYPNEKWEIFIKAMLLQKFPIQSRFSFFEGRSNQNNEQIHTDGYSISIIDADFMSRKWENIEWLADEMSTKRESVDEFLCKSFGVCITDNDQIVGWCLSEYNTVHRCEIDIAVLEDNRRSGLATTMVSAFLELARTKDIARIGWHCSSSNAGAVKTAIRSGFSKIEDYPVFIGWFDDAVNIARNGYFAHGRGEYAEALNFYEKSLLLGDVPDWVYWSAACDAVLIENKEKSLYFLSKAIDHGFDDIEEIRSSKYFVSLHEMSAWQELITKLKDRSE